MFPLVNNLIFPLDLKQRSLQDSLIYGLAHAVNDCSLIMFHVILLNQHPALSGQSNPTLRATETNPKNAKHSAIHILTILWVLSLAV